MADSQQETKFLEEQLLKQFRGKINAWGFGILGLAFSLTWLSHSLGTPTPNWYSVFINQIASVLWGIVASLLMIWGIDRFYKKSFGDKLEELERNKMQRKFVEAMNASLGVCNSGITKIHAKLNTEELTAMLSQAREKIWIVENWMCLTNDQIQSFIKTACSSSNPNISIALLHPYSPNTTRRSADVAEVGGDHLSLDEDIIAQLKLIAQTYGGLRPEVQASCRLLCHECIPSIQVYLTETRALIGFYLQETRSADGMQIEVHAGGDLYEAVHKHVKYIMESRIDGHAVTEIKARGLQEGPNSQLLNELHSLVGRQIHGLRHRLRNLKFHSTNGAEKVELQTLKNNEAISNEERIKEAFKNDREAKESLRNLARIVAKA